jgi:hypothetical protein
MACALQKCVLAIRVIANQYGGSHDNRREDMKMFYFSSLSLFC